MQGLYLAFLLLVGYEFWRFHEQAIGPGSVTAARPPSVESFLPISALVGLKRFLLTGYWDPVHPAGLTILAAALVGAFLARKAFCGWICPVGTLSRGLEWVGEKLFWRRRWPTVPRWLDLALTSVKYLLLAFFAWAILWQMPLAALEGFQRSPYNVAADAKMLHFFLGLTATSAWVLGGLVLLSLVVKNAWCRWGCPYGALLGLASYALPAPDRPRRRDLQRLRRLHARLPGGHPGPRPGPGPLPGVHRVPLLRGGQHRPLLPGREPHEAHLTLGAAGGRGRDHARRSGPWPSPPASGRARCRSRPSGAPTGWRR